MVSLPPRVLRDRIEIIRKSTWLDDDGLAHIEWDTVATLPAAVHYQSSVAAGGTDNWLALVEDVRAVIRPWPDLDPDTDRIGWRGHTWTPTGVLTHRVHGRDHHWTVKLVALT